MNIRDILEAEQLKYCYEQAYALHRHTDIPDMFVRAPDTVFTLPSAGDRTVGWDAISEKFCHDLYYVSPGEDSFHTGWQICAPVLWEEDGEIRGIFPTFGFLVLSMDPETMKPPYRVLSTLELWQDRFAGREDRLRIHYLEAQFLVGQCVWRWNAREDSGLAARKKLREIPHPVLNPGSPGPDASPTAEQSRLTSSVPETHHQPAAAPAPDASHSGRAADLFGIQFAQGLYTLLWQCGRMHEIPDEVFCDAEEISVSYGEGERASGPEAVRRFFREMKERTSEQGGLLRVDMPATQWIRISPCGETAEGCWTTVSRQIEDASSGKRHRIGIGQFSNTFRKENEVWKLKNVRFEMLQEFAPFEETPDVNLENYRKNPEGWLKELPRLRPVSAEGGGREAAEILLLRNEIQSWFHWFNMGKAQEEAFPCGSESARSKVREMCGGCRYILATSPVLRMDASLCEAEAFFSASLLTERGKDEMTDVRGGIGMTLIREKTGWEIRQFSWYPYASLDSWKVK